MRINWLPINPGEDIEDWHHRCQQHYKDSGAIEHEEAFRKKLDRYGPQKRDVCFGWTSNNRTTVLVHGYHCQDLPSVLSGTNFVYDFSFRPESTKYPTKVDKSHEINFYPAFQFGDYKAVGWNDD